MKTYVQIKTSSKTSLFYLRLDFRVTVFTHNTTNVQTIDQRDNPRDYPSNWKECDEANISSIGCDYFINRGWLRWLSWSETIFIASHSQAAKMNHLASCLTACLLIYFFIYSFTDIERFHSALASAKFFQHFPSRLFSGTSLNVAQSVLLQSFSFLVVFGLFRTREIEI